MSTDTLCQQAYRHIQKNILSGVLPIGSMVSELSLAKEIGVSRTPVREAVQQLRMEGFLEQVPRHGTIVRKPDRREIIELYQLREGLESYGVLLATERIGPADLASLGTLCEQTRLIGDQMQQTGLKSLDGPMMRRFLAADMAFHMLLIGAAGNRRIMSIVGNSHVMTRIFGTPRAEHDLQVVNATYRCHSDILRAVKDSDGKLARQLMEEHVRGSLQKTLDSYDRVQAESDGHRPIPLDLPEEVQEELARIEQELSANDSDQTTAKERSA